MNSVAFMLKLETRSIVSNIAVHGNRLNIKMVYKQSRLSIFLTVIITEIELAAI
jgi:hypothetical protein